MKAPRWFIAVAVIVAAVAVFQFPLVLSQVDADSTMIHRLLVWGDPFFEVLGAWLAVRCYPDRREMAWILIVLAVLTQIAVFMI